MPSKVTLGDELLFAKDYVCAEELDGKDMDLTIDAISKEPLQVKRGPKVKKPVLTFKEINVKNDKKPYKLVLNVSNANSICVMHGNRAELWVGKRITIFPTTTQFGSDTVTCVRIREKIPTDNKPAAADSLHKGWHEAIDKAETPEQLLAVAAKFDSTKGKDKKVYVWPVEMRAEFGVHYDMKMEQLKAPQPPAEAPAPREPGDESEEEGQP